MQQMLSNLIAEHSCRLLQPLLPNGMFRSGDIVIQTKAPNSLTPITLPSHTTEAMCYSFSHNQLTAQICAHTQELSTQCEYHRFPLSVLHLLAW